MDTNKTKMMDCEITVEKYLLHKKNNGVPFGHFCYEDVNDYVRYYCPYLDGCGNCLLMRLNGIFDLIKICGLNRG